jgi:hypothetical protein
VTGAPAATAVDPLRTGISLIVPLALLGVLAFFVLRMHRASGTGPRLVERVPHDPPALA